MAAGGPRLGRFLAPSECSYLHLRWARVPRSERSHRFDFIVSPSILAHPEARQAMRSLPLPDRGSWGCSFRFRLTDTVTRCRHLMMAAELPWASCVTERWVVPNWDVLEGRRPDAMRPSGYGPGKTCRSSSRARLRSRAGSAGAGRRRRRGSAVRCWRPRRGRRGWVPSAVRTCSHVQLAEP